MNGLRYRTFTGEQVREVIPQLGKLRIRVFYDFPYLYEGDLEYEKNYLEIYTKEKSIVHGVFDGEQMVGATTGMPLVYETKEVRKPFLDSGMDVTRIFYFGESVLLENYRGQGLGHHFFDVREKHALENGFETTVFCSVIRPENHPLKPENYRSNDAFWLKRGYEKQAFSCEMSWLDRGEPTESTKELQFWMKTWK